jgi:hypothetical protein
MGGGGAGGVHARFCWGSLVERGYWEDLGLDEIITLHKVGRRGTDSSGIIAGCCEDGNELSSAVMWCMS